jgi:ribulose-bisphosphate carboxylase large chain
MIPRLLAIYRIRSDAASIVARAEAVAVEQSVEMPLAAIDDETVCADIVGRVERIRDLGDGCFEVGIALAASTTGGEAGQLMNMLFGNTSIQEDVALVDVIFPAAFADGFGGPGHGIDGLRRRMGAKDRALTASALKPQGLPPRALAALAGRLAAGGLDLIKDDHGLADQAYSRFAERVPRCADAVAEAARGTGMATRYLPSLSGNLDRLREQIGVARRAGLDAVLVAPLIVGLPAFHTLVRENRDFAFMAHPAMAGAARIAPPLLLGTLFRLFGADATVFPNHGGRFGYTPTTCLDLAAASRREFAGLRSTLPVPAGGMTLDRVPEMLDFYGPDTMLLIGGGLLAAGDRMTAEAAAFAQAVWRHEYRQRPGP